MADNNTDKYNNNTNANEDMDTLSKVSETESDSHFTKKSMTPWIVGGSILVVAAVVVVFAVMHVLNRSPASANQTAVKLDGATVTVAEAQAYYNTIYEQYGYANASTAETEELKIQVLTQIAQEKIADLKVKELGLDALTDEDKAKAKTDADDEYNAMLEMYGDYFQNDDGTLTAEELKKATEEYFAANGYTREIAEQEYLAAVPYSRLFEQMTKDIVVTDEEVDAKYAADVEQAKQTYENNISDYEIEKQYYGTVIPYVPAGFRGVRHILLAIPESEQTKIDELEAQMEAISYEIDQLSVAASDGETESESETEPMTEEERAKLIEEKETEIKAKQDEIDAIIANLPVVLEPQIAEIKAAIESGESFGSLIEKYGTDPGMTAEPAMSKGYEIHKESVLYDETFRDTAFALVSVGDVSEPTPTAFGVHFIEYTGDVEDGAVELTEEGREAIRAELLDAKSDETINSQFEAWMNDYHVELFPELIATPNELTSRIN